MASIAEKRKKFMAHLTKVMDLLDPSGTNSQIYREKFESMSDAQFDSYIKKFFKDPKQNFYLEIVEYERDLTIEQIQKCADYMKVPLLERVAYPYLNGDSEDVEVSPYPIPVGYINMKRLQQTLINKSHGSTEIDKRSPLSGQVNGHDKNARNSDLESYCLAAVGGDAALAEFMDPRADNEKAKRQMELAISRDGYVSLKDLDLADPYHKVALNTFNTYYLMQGIGSNLVCDTEHIPGPRKRD